MEGPLPRFLCLGVQKGGTTTLQLMLEQHPGVFLPAGKELHYFSLHYGEGEAWYREQFTAAHPDQICGEITPYYVFHPEAPVRIQQLLPEAKLIVLLRDPVERTLSQFFHSRRWGLETLDLEEALAAEEERLEGADAVLAAEDGRHRSHQEHSYLARSRYGEQLQRLEDLFPAEQLLVLRSEDLFRQPEPLWQRLQAFLELEPWPLPVLEQPANAGSGEAAAVPENVRQKLRDSLAPTYAWVTQRYGIRWD